MYCLTCRKVTESVDIVHKISKNNRNLLTGRCAVCDSGKSKFIAAGKLLSEGEEVRGGGPSGCIQ